MRRRRKSWMNPKLKLIILFTFIVCAGVAAGMLFTPVFHIQEVYCEGNSRLTSEEIIEAAQVQTGKNILTENLSQIKKRVLELPMVEEAGVRRIFPNKIKIWVRERIPAAYIYTENQCAIVDLNGKILEMITDSRVEEMIKAYTPVRIKKTTDTAEEDNQEQSPSPDVSSKPTASSKPNSSAQPTSSAQTAQSNQSVGTSAPETAEQTTAENTDVQQEETSVLAYQAPLIVGLRLEKPAAGKNAESKENEKLQRTQETLRCLEKVGLLERATYLDVTNMNDVILVIENRLEIELGSLENMEYRSAFLAKVINEKISSTEQVIMDYRSEDIYVRQPEDGQAWMAEKPSASLQPTGSANPENTASAPAKTGSSAVGSAESESTASAASKSGTAPSGSARAVQEEDGMEE